MEINNLSAMDEAFGDLPRPDHPDFWKISSVVLKMDAEVEEALKDGGAEAANEIFEKRVRSYVDLDSVTYVAIQRVLRLLAISSREELERRLGWINHCVALYIDAFVMGTEYGIQHSS